MTCGNDSSTMGPQVIYSKKDDTNWLVHTFSTPESTTELKSVRASIENRSSTGAIKTRAYYRTSNDGATWGAWTLIYTSGTNEQTNDGTSYGPSFTDLSSVVQDKQLIQFGVGAVNTSGSATEMTTCTLKIDRKKG